jgi:MFS family permease
LIIDLTNWQVAFLLNLPVGLIAWWLARSRLAESQQAELGARPDVIGVAMLTIGVGLLTLGIVQSNVWGWMTAATAGALGGGAAIMVIFVFWASGRSTAALDLTLFADRNYRYVNLATFVFGIVFSMMFLSSFVFLTGVWGYSLSLAGIGITPGPLLVIPVAIASGRVAARIGHRPLLMAGGLFFAASALWMYLNIGREPEYLRVWLPGQLIGGLGVGLVLPSLSGAAVAGLAAHRFGIGSAVNVAVRQIGGTIGVAAAIALVGLPRAGIERFHSIYICMAIGGILTALLSTPVDTRSKNGDKS